MPAPPGAAVAVNIVDLTDVDGDELPEGVERGRYLAAYFEDDESMSAADWQAYVDAWVPPAPTRASAPSLDERISELEERLAAIEASSTDRSTA